MSKRCDRDGGASRVELLRRFRRGELRRAWVEAFSDGVLAIVIGPPQWRRAGQGGPQRVSPEGSAEAG